MLVGFFHHTYCEERTHKVGVCCNATAWCSVNCLLLIFDDVDVGTDFGARHKKKKYNMVHNIHK